MPAPLIRAFTFAVALGGALTTPLAAQGGCLAVALSGVAGPTVFADGFESGDALRWSEPDLPAFSTAATDDLGIAVDLDGGTTGDHLLELAWYLPGEGLYQSVAVPFTAGEAPAASQRRVDGYPFPVAVRPAVENRRPQLGSVVTVADSLPVAGSSIADAALWGEWRVEARLDGAAEPCAPAVAFRMEP